MKFTCTKCQAVNTIPDKTIAKHLARKGGKAATSAQKKAAGIAGAKARWGKVKGEK